MAAGDFGVHCQGGDGVLDAGAAGVLDADDRAADFDGHVHDFADFAAEGDADGSAVDGFVVGVDGDGASADATVAGDDAVAVGGVGFVGGAAEGSDFDEGAFVEQAVDALAWRG